MARRACRAPLPLHGVAGALTTLNTGRITLPAACAGMTSRCLDMTRRWTAKREQWGRSICQHAAVADKVAAMAADDFALRAIVHYVSSLVDADKHADVRLEAAIAKLWGTETAWRIIDDTMQIRGGRGFETAQSLKARGELPEPVERFFRDARINTIFEGSTEIMRLFIAREALDPHLKIGSAVINPTLPVKQRVQAALKAAGFYSHWYPARWFSSGLGGAADHIHPTLQSDVHTIHRLSNRLARGLFHAMALNGPSLERKQVLLGKFVDIGAELFVWSCALGHASHLATDSRLNNEKVDRPPRPSSYHHFICGHTTWHPRS